jgi:hypothetical protein
LAPGGRRVPCHRLVQRFDERREADLGLALVGRPHASLFAVLPLNSNGRDQPRSVFHRMGELAVAAVELDAADGSDVIRRFERSHHPLRVTAFRLR